MDTHRYRWVPMGVRTLLCLSVVAFAGCATTGAGVTLPPLPIWPTTVQAETFPALRVASESRQRYPAAKVAYADNTYTVVPRDWLNRYLTWTWEAAKAAGVAYTPESFDCDDFSLGFYFFATRAAAKAQVRAAPLIARIVVAWDAGQLHELIAVVTDQGILIVEPQPDAGPFRTTPLEKFTRTVLAITWGDAGTG